MSLSPEDLEKRFAFSKPDPNNETHQRRLLQHDHLRASFTSMANFVNELNPGSRESAIALTELESASHWAHKALSRKIATEQDA